MSNDYFPTLKEIKEKRIKIGVAILSVALVGLLISSLYKSEKVNASSNQSKNKYVTKNIDFEQHFAEPEQAWKALIDDKVKDVDVSVKKIEGNLSSKVTEIQKDLESRLEELKQQNEWQRLEMEELKKHTEANQLGANANQNINIQENSDINQSELPNVNKISFKISEKAQSLAENKKNIITVRNSIIEGTMIPATLVTGAYFDTDLSAQDRPLPVHIRVTDLSILPNNIRDSVKDCTVIAGGFGKLGHERAYIRPVRISCMHKDGYNIAAKLEGFITGPDGDEGIAGEVISKDKMWLQNSAITGILSGLAKSADPGPKFINPFASGAPGRFSSPAMGERFASGMSDSVSNSLEKQADYMLKKAESLEPVIHVRKGQSLTIHVQNSVKFWLTEDAKDESINDVILKSKRALLEENHE